MSIFSFQDVVYLGLIIVTSYVVNFYLNHFRRPDRLPGPLPLPLIGNLYQYTNDLSAWMNWLQTNYGGIGEIWFGGEKVIWLGKAEYLGKILKSSAGNYNLRTTPHEGLDILGMSSKGIIFNRNYDTWSINRKYFTRAISSAVFLRQSVKYTRSLFLEVEKYWEDLERRNIEIDMANWMLRFFAEATFLITTNKKCYALKNHHDVLRSSEKEVADTEILIGHFKSIFDGFEFFLKTPKFMHDLPIFNKHVKKFLSSFDWMRKNYILGIVKKRREEIKRTPIDQELTSDMLTMMITFNTIRDTSQENTSTDKSLEPMSDEDICENLFEAAIAGIETTTDTFCYIVYYLCQYPEIKKCVSEEIQKVFGTNSKVDDIGYEELSKLNYCEAVIKEVSRIRTLSPLLLRMAEHSDEINGHKLEASTPIFINAQEIHMSELYWENPEIFDPGRFLTSADDKNVNNKIKKNSFLAFGGGIRVCPGRNLAIVELKTLMVLLFSKYEVEFVDPSAPIKAHCTVANHCDELKVKLVNIHN